MDLVIGLVVWMGLVAGAWRGEEDSLVGSSGAEKNKEIERKRERIKNR